MEASQTVMKFFQKHDILFTASRTGDLHYWKWGNIPEHYNKRKKKEESTAPRVAHSGIGSLRSPLQKLQQSANSSVINMNSSKREMFFVYETHPNVHSDLITDMLLLPKENRIVLCSMDSTIKMFDIDKKDVAITLRGHKQGVFAVTWCSEYQFLISAGFEHEALVWTSNIDAPPFKLRDQRKPHQHSLVNVVAVPHSPQVITADHKGMVKIWDVRTFNCVQTIYTESNLPKNDYHSFYLNSFIYMDKRKEIVTAGRRIHIYEFERTANPTLADDQPISICTYNPSTFTFLTVAGCDIKVWDALTGCIQKVFKDISSSEITSLALDDRGRKFFIGTHKGKITAHNSMNGTLVKKFKKHSGEVTSLTYTDDSMKYLVSTSWDSTVRILSDRDASEGMDARQPLTIHEMDVKVSCYHKQYCVAATGDVTGKILIIDVRSLKWGGVECNQHRGEITAIRFLGTYPAFVSADSAGYLHLWTIKPYPINPHKKVMEWRNHTFTPLARDPTLRESPFLTQSSRVYSDGTPYEEEEEMTTYSAPQIPVDDSQPSIPVTCIDFDPATNYLYTGDEKGYIVCWDMNEVVEVANLRYSGRGASTPAAQSTLNINHLRENWERLQSHRLQRSFYWKAHTDCIKTIQIVRDPACIISSGYDSAVNIWTKKGELMDSLRQDRKDGHDDEFTRKNRNPNDDVDFKPFNFPVNLEKRRREDAQTVSNVINRIKKQLRIITLWKNKSKTSTLTALGSTESMTLEYPDYEFAQEKERSDEEDDETNVSELTPSPSHVSFAGDKTEKALPEFKERENPLRTIIQKNRVRTGSPSNRPGHSPVRRSSSSTSLTGTLSRRGSTFSNQAVAKFPSLTKKFLPSLEENEEDIVEEIIEETE
jgi:WD40 repeat protein